jgi:hypothetical protein
VPRGRRQLPPPLPPAERTVGQVIAETIRLYGERFWPSIMLGLGPAVLFAMVQPLPPVLQLPVAATAGSLLMTASFVGACVIVGGKTPFEFVKQGFFTGLLIWPTVALLPLLFAASGSVWVTLVAPFPLILFWLGYVGMSVPAAVIERLRYREALVRGMELGKADFVHVLGTLATLVITYQLTGGVLFFLLHGTSDLQLAVAGFLATVVISPMIFLGSALVYFDQKARLDKVRARASERSVDADLHPADDVDGPGSADAEGEPRPAARSEP